MKLSKRITGLVGKAGDGWGLFLKAREMMAAGKDVTELTIGEHDIGTAPEILAAMDRAAQGGHTGYAMVPGIDALRDKVAARIQAQSGVACGRDNVLIVPGGQSGLFTTHMAVCDPGDRALFIDPYYATYPGTIRAASAIPVPVQAKAADQFQPDMATLDAAAEGAKSLLINTPNNPTGVIYSRDTLAGIADICRDRDMWLISDEVYDTQVWDGEHISPRALPDMAAHTLVIGSMSKSHAMTGSRIGWVIGPDEVIGHMINLATNTTYGVAGFVQMAALFALDQGDALEERIAAPFRRRRDAALRLIATQNVVQIVPAQGAMYLMLDIRATGMSGEDFALALLEQEKIAVMPGESFGQAAAGHVRIAMTVEDARFTAALQRVIGFAQSLAVKST